MIAQWTVGLVGEMHRNSITRKELAAQVGWSYTYTVSVINGKESPKNAESKLTAALNQLIKEKQSDLSA